MRSNDDVIDELLNPGAPKLAEGFLGEKDFTQAHDEGCQVMVTPHLQSELFRLSHLLRSCTVLVRLGGFINTR